MVKTGSKEGYLRSMVDHSKEKSVSMKIIVEHSVQSVVNKESRKQIHSYNKKTEGKLQRPIRNNCH